MKLEIIYLKKADKFFTQNSTILSKQKSKELIMKAIKKIIKKEDININVKRLPNLAVKPSDLSVGI